MKELKFIFFKGNACALWALFCITEALMIKSLLMTKFKYFGNINDGFFSRFIFFWNILFNFGSMLYLLLSGILRSDGVLTGIKGTPHRISIFYPILIGTLSVVSCLSAITIAVKKYQAHQSDKNLVKNIKIMIINDGGEPKEQFNTQKYNKPITDTIMITTLTFLGVGSVLTYIVFFNVNDSTSDYVKSFWYNWARNIFFRTILPILTITFYHKDFQRFILKTCHDMCSNVCLQNNRIQPIFPR